MDPTELRRGTDDEQRVAILGRAAALSVVLMMVLSVSAGVAVADDVGATTQQQESNDTYAVTQDDDCIEIAPLSGNESVKSFYDYRTPIADNPYTNTTGQSYSSKGTITLQQPNTSSLFLYEDQTGNLSLVFLHGSVDNASDGGSVTFTITGLPGDGSWAVKDDEYEGEDRYDVWNESDGVHRVDWTWGQGKTDGGAYTGLGDEFEITIEPAFNAEAELFEEYYNGTVEDWSVLSNGQGAVDRTSLSEQSVTISSDGC